MSTSNVSRKAAYGRLGRRPVKIIAVIVPVMVLAMMGLQMGLAQTGAAPDPAFGKKGLVATKFAGADDEVLGVAIGSDGSIYAAGSTGKKKRERGLLAKYTESGTLDTTFGSSGKVVDNNLVTAQAIVLQPDGQLLVAGVSTGFRLGGPAFALERYNTDGTLDPSFGSGGVVLDTIGTAGDFIDAITIQPNGQILIGGNTVVVEAITKKREAINGDFALARYNSNGAIDTSFGTNGKVTTDFNGFLDSIKTILIQPNGDIVAAGNAGVATDTLPNPIAPGGSATVFGFARYNSDGGLDTSFGQQGLVTVAVDGVGSEMASAALQSNGQIVASGATAMTLAVVRLNSDGSLDSSFGISGFPGQAFMPLLTDFACIDRSSCDATYSPTSVIQFQADGTILVYGAIGSEHWQVYAASYTANGALNTSYGNNGVLTGKFVRVGKLNVVALQPDGLLLAGGGMHTSSAREEFALARYTVPGS